MASSYYYRKYNRDVGPVVFDELILLVRNDELEADDLVKCDWESDWHPAVEVVGLFHMAGRDDVVTRYKIRKQQELARLEQGDINLDEMLSAAQALPEDAEEMPSWQRRLNQLASQQIASGHTAQPRDVQPVDMDAALDAAIANYDARQTAKRRFFKQPKTLLPIHTATRWIMAIVMANVIAWSVYSWSKHEARRYPNADKSVTLTPFPLVGKCNNTQYAFLLTDLMLASAGFGYFLARVLESVAEDS